MEPFRRVEVGDSVGAFGMRSAWLDDVSLSVEYCCAEVFALSGNSVMDSMVPRILSNRLLCSPRATPLCQVDSSHAKMQGRPQIRVDDVQRIPTDGPSIREELTWDISQDEHKSSNESSRSL